MFLLWYHSLVAYISFLLWKILVPQVLYPRLSINWKCWHCPTYQGSPACKLPPRLQNAWGVCSQGTLLRRIDDVSTSLGNGRSSPEVWKEQTLTGHLNATNNSGIFGKAQKSRHGIQAILAILIYLRVLKDLEDSERISLLEESNTPWKELILRTMGQTCVKVARLWWILGAAYHYSVHTFLL